MTRPNRVSQESAPTALPLPRKAGLRAADLAMFRKLRIPPAMLQGTVRRITDREARGEFGFRNKKNLDGLAFLYHDQASLKNGSKPTYVRIRRDYYDPDIKDDPKYVGQGKEQAERQFFWVASVAAKLNNAVVPLVLVESEKATMAVTAWVKRVGLEFVVQGMGGDWGWRQKEKGRSRSIPDLAAAKDGRRVYILLDANQNDEVAKAQRLLYQQLRKQGADPRVVKLPDGPNWNGPDDYLAANSDAALSVLFHEANEATSDWHYGLLTNASGAPLACLANALSALREAPQWVGVLAWDQFAHRVRVRREPPWGDDGKDTPWSDRTATLTAEWLQRNRINVGTPVVVEAASVVAQEHGFHPVREYLDGLAWDGTERLNTWLPRYLGAEDSPFTRAVSRCWLISGVARVYRPGCKVDHTLTLLGAQGIYKSRAFRALAVKEEWFTDHVSELGSKDSRMELLGKWIVEFSDLTGLRGRDWEHVKGFLTTETDNFRAPYGHLVEDHLRQCIFGASTNQETPMSDETGNRRFWPVHCAGKIDIVALEADRDQLWAEAVARYRKGESWWLKSDKLIAAAEAAQADLHHTGPWDEKILEWLDDGPFGNEQHLSKPEGQERTRKELESKRNAVMVGDILEHCLEIETKYWKQGDMNSVVRCLKHAGWKLQRAGTGTRQKFYVRPGTERPYAAIRPRTG